MANFKIEYGRMVIIFMYIVFSSGDVELLPSPKAEKVLGSKTCSNNLDNMLFMSFGKFIEDGNSFVCGLQAFNSKKSYYVMNKDRCYIPKGSVSNNDNLQFPYIYHKVASPLLLLRVVAESEVRLYDMFTTDMNYNGDIREPTYKDMNYKSALLQEWSDMRPTLIKVTVRGTHGVVAWLTFKVSSVDTTFSWFRQSNLVASHPWDVNLLKKGSYNYFSVDGWSNSLGSRRFYINRSFGGCPYDFGVLVIFDQKDDCNYKPDLNPNFKSPKIFYTINKGDGANTNHYSSYGKYFELWATYGDDVLFMA